MKFRFIAVFALFAFLFNSEVFAQYTSFGKNRVQYENFEWRFIQSKHFDIYYYGEKNYELAEFSAQSLESAYMQLQDDFDHQIVDRIPLIIYDSHNDFSQTNVVALPTSAEGIGGVTDKFKNRMTVPFDGDYNDFRRTLHHELVHAVFNDMFYGGSVQSIIRNNIQLVFLGNVANGPHIRGVAIEMYWHNGLCGSCNCRFNELRINLTMRIYIDQNRFSPCMDDCRNGRDSSGWDGQDLVTRANI